MESSRRDLSNDMAEHGPILKNNLNAYNPRFGLTQNTGMASPKTGDSFLQSYMAKSHFKNVINTSKYQ